MSTPDNPKDDCEEIGFEELEDDMAEWQDELEAEWEQIKAQEEAEIAQWAKEEAEFHAEMQEENYIGKCSTRWSCLYAQQQFCWVWSGNYEIF